MSTPPLTRTSLFSSMMRREENCNYAKAQAARISQSHIDELACPHMHSGDSHSGTHRAVRSRSCSPHEGHSGYRSRSASPERDREYRSERDVGSKTLKKIDAAVLNFVGAAPAES